MRGNKKKWLGIATMVAFALTLFLFWLLYEPQYHGRPISDWVSELNSKDNEVQARAQTVIAEMGPEAVPYLEKEVNVTGRGKYPELRGWVTKVTKSLPAGIGKPIRRRWGAPGGYFAGSGASIALAAFREDAKPAIPALLAAMDDPDANVRSHAACALLQIAPDDTALMRQVLIKAAKDSESWILSNVSNHFAEFPKDSDETVQLFVEIYPKGVPQVQYNILRALGDFHSPSKAVMSLLEQAKSSKVEEERAGAALAISKLNETDEAAINELIKAAQSKNFMLQAQAVKRLAELGKKAPQASVQMRSLMAAQSSYLQVYSINYLVRTGEARSSLPAMIYNNLSRSSDDISWGNAVGMFTMVEEIHPDDRLKTKAIAELLAGRTAKVRLTSLRALARFGPAEEVYVKDIVASLDDESLEIRLAAARAILALQPENAILHQTLKQWLGGDGYFTKLEAVRLIQAHPEFQERYRSQLQALTKAKGERLRKAASEALAPPKEGVKPR